MFTALEAKILAAIAAIAAALIMFGLYTAHEQKLGAAEAVAVQAQQALAGERAARAESDRRTIAIQQKATNADQAASAARADADAAHSAGERLRQRIAALNRGAADHSAATPAGAASASADVVSADLFASVVYTAGRYAAIADAARIAGQACQQSYDALGK